MRTKTKMTHMHPGDMIRSDSPKHKLDAWHADLAKQGYAFRFDPTTSGYMVTCVASPHVPDNKTRH